MFFVPPVTDNTAAMLNAVGILLALYERERTGEGQRLETSLVDAGLPRRSRLGGVVPRAAPVRVAQ